MTYTSANSALILLGHGSRDPQWREPMQRMQQTIQQQKPHIPVRCAYLELCEPDLFAATQALLSEHPGLQSIVIYPVFIGMGAHARQDLPQLHQQLAQQYPQLQWTLAPALGTDTRLAQLVAEIAQPWLGDVPARPTS